MRGLLADVDVQGRLDYLRRCLASMDPWDLLVEEGIGFATLADHALKSGRLARAPGQFVVIVVDDCEGPLASLTEVIHEASVARRAVEDRGALPSEPNLGRMWEAGHMVVTPA